MGSAISLVNELKKDRDAWKARAEAEAKHSVHAITCIHHTDIERAEIDCPCCLRARAEKAEAELLVDKALADETITLLADRDRLRAALRCIQQEPQHPSRVVEIACRALTASESKEPQVAAVTHDMNCKKLNIHGAECTCGAEEPS